MEFKIKEKGKKRTKCFVSTQVEILICDLRGGEWDARRCAGKEPSKIKAKPCNAL